MTEPEPTAAAAEEPLTPVGTPDQPDPEATDVEPDVDAVNARAEVDPEMWPRHAVTEVLPIVPTAEEPLAGGADEEPTGEEPTGEEPTGEEPTDEEPTDEEPTGEEPTDEEPTGEEPTDEEPTDEEPTDDLRLGDADLTGTTPDADALPAESDLDEPGVDEPSSAEPLSASISGVDIREIDLADMAEVEKLFGLAPLTQPTSPDPKPTAELPAVVRNADAVAALYAAGSAPDEETWDGRYRGRRRARVTELRFWLAALAVLAAIGAAMYLTLSLAPPPGREVAAPTEPGPDSAAIIPAGPTRSPSVAASTTPTPAPTSPKPTPSPTPKATTGSPSPPPPPPFEPLTIEAEVEPGAVTGGGAQPVPYAGASGGSIVYHMGTFGSPPGTLTLPSVSVPIAGIYTVIIYYVHPSDVGPRQLVITVNSTPLPALDPFVTNNVCCQQRAVQVTLAAGTNVIVFSNPTGPAPALDKILIKRPD